MLRSGEDLTGFARDVHQRGLELVIDGDTLTLRDAQTGDVLATVALPTVGVLMALRRAGETGWP